ncbi:hypothetical protein M9H77_28802 [Catharanthus roseus]|uniref:Uncharacterized protein n=1 Tax=Catharanthus roseus TaxID=4058 RepID=A0ACC0AGQ4_CATRO|nr:hypothetical protein M9H77_28802 [Catharanthus roseus]
MAFFSKARSILQHTVTKHINQEISASRPSILQAIRCMSQSKLFIGGISYQSDESSLREAFSKYGDVVEARIITDRDTGRSRGFGFVTFTSSEEASAAIQALDGQELHGRRVRVNFANDRSQGFGRGGGGYGGQGGYGGGGSYGGYGGGQGSYGGQGGYGGNYNNSSGSGSYGAGGGYNTTGGDSYGSGGAGYGSSGNYPSGNSYDSGSVSYGAGSGQNFGVAGGTGGSDNYAAANNFTSSGYTANQGTGYGDGNQFDSNESSSKFGSADDVLSQGENSFQDDNEPQDYADKRA